MKKILCFIFALFALSPALLFAGCAGKDSGIDMNVYFNKKVNYTLYSQSGTTEDSLSQFTDNKFNNKARYMSITLTGNSAWLYKMTVEKIEFKVFSTLTEELQFNIHISNLKGGDKDVNRDPKFQKMVSAKAGKAVTVSVPINDYFESNSQSITIVIELDGTQYYFADGKETDLKIDISSIKVFGSHDLSKAK